MTTKLFHCYQEIDNNTNSTHIPRGRGVSLVDNEQDSRMEQERETQSNKIINKIYSDVQFSVLHFRHKLALPVEQEAHHLPIVNHNNQKTPPCIRGQHVLSSHCRLLIINKANTSML